MIMQFEHIATRIPLNVRMTFIQSVLYKLGFLDAVKLTNRGDGYSNRIWHVDEIHHSPDGMLQAFNHY